MSIAAIVHIEFKLLDTSDINVNRLHLFSRLHLFCKQLLAIAYDSECH